MKQTVAIIGADEPDGRILALAFANAGCRILLSDKVPQRAHALLSELRRANAQTDAEILDCARTSCWEADIIIVASPFASRDEVIAKIREVSTGKIVAAVVSSSSAARQYARSLPHSRFVSLASAGAGYVLTGDDDEALDALRRLLEAGGADVVPSRPSAGRQHSSLNQ